MNADNVLTHYTCQAVLALVKLSEKALLVSLTSDIQDIFPVLACILKQTRAQKMRKFGEVFALTSRLEKNLDRDETSDDSEKALVAFGIAEAPPATGHSTLLRKLVWESHNTRNEWTDNNLALTFTSLREV